MGTITEDSYFQYFFFKSRKKRVYIYYIYKPVFKNAPNLKISIRYIYTFFSHQEENFLTRKQNKKQTNKKKENIYIYIYIWEVCVSIFPLYSARYIEVERDIH